MPQRNLKLKKKKYYACAVPEKKIARITENWEECEKIVKGEKSARYRSFANKHDAETWLAAGAHYEKRIKTAAESGVYFDAGTGRGSGVEVNVTSESGISLLANLMPQKKLTVHGTELLKDKTNNYGELLAAKYALQIAMEDGVKKVFGDSRLVLEYWSRGHIKREMAEETRALAYEVAALRRRFEAGGGVMRHISGADNPADLGFHK